jgi:hypothetical protein
MVNLGGGEVECRRPSMFNKVLAPTFFLLLAVGDLQAADEKEPKYGWEYVRALVEIRGQLNFSEKDKEPGRGFVRVGHQFGLQVFLLDWSEAPQLRDLAKNLDGKWVLLTGSLTPPGREYVTLGYAGTVKVATLTKVSGPPRVENPSKK